MILTKMLGLDLKEVKVVLMGIPEETAHLDSDDQPYFKVGLKDPIKVLCSMDAAIEPEEVDEIYIRKSALDLDGWEFVNGKDATEGYFMPKWVVDFSKGQQIPIYQETTIKKWTKENRSVRADSRRDLINDGIRQRMAKRAAK
jgi:hypothetical protein